jgi:LAO/AO transport system kinase
MLLKKQHSLSYYYDGLLAANRVVLGQAITLIESFLPEDEALAEALLDKILPRTGGSFRIGITGVPGVGKSTFIESFGTYIIDKGKRVAVLTVDPSSQVTKGSILGDKTRMDSLSKNPHAFIRPTASGSVLGGVAIKTREAILLCEAAGFDVTVVETVGTGQSETTVKNMTDFFLLLMLAGAGDELQGIKKGIMEMADAVVITKADGDNSDKATRAQADYQHALHLMQPAANEWIPQVLTCSAIENKGIAEIWQMLQTFENQQKINGEYNANRQQQNISWMMDCFDLYLKREIERSAMLTVALQNLQEKVSNHQLTASAAAKQLLIALKDAKSF